MKYALIIILISLSSCLTDSMEQKIDKQMKVAEETLADQEFRRVLASIELHRLRTGQYPENLDSIKFKSIWDQGSEQHVDYTRFDEGYELDLIMEFPSFSGKGNKQTKLKYPKEFWIGLGCVSSNTME